MLAVESNFALEIVWIILTIGIGAAVGLMIYYFGKKFIDWWKYQRK